MGVSAVEVSTHFHSLEKMGTISFPGSLVFPLEVEESSVHRGAAGRAAELSASLALLHENLAFLLRPQSLSQSKLLRDVLAYKERMRVEEEEFDVVTLAAHLSNVGYRVHIRNALGGGQGTDCFHNLRHEFLVVQGEGEHGSVDFLVEPAFQAQFKISHSTPRYDGLLAMVPSALVTTAAMLGPLVQLLCAEMQLAFEHHGLSLPPWRQAKSMLSKWLPQKSKDIEPSPYGSPRAASPEACFPLLGPAATTGTAPSSTGCPTPGATEEPEAVSPRAVLSGASAMLISQASVAHPQPKFKAKSLLSDCLLQQQQQPQPAQRGGGDVCGGGGARTPRRCSSERVVHMPAAVLQPQQQGREQGQQQRPAAACVAPAEAPNLHRVSAESGIVYRVDSEWQEPPIRKVKMQGSAAQKDK